MAWLTGWGKRVKLTTDKNDITAVLSNFPILIYLSASSGRNNDDVTCVFDEIGSSRKKIAVTKADGTTQLYVEIEKWDSVAEKAWLWVKVPHISDVVDTNFYLYYDKTHADNTVYVGDPNSTPAEKVWDSHAKLVIHMQDDPDASHVRDSTSNDNDGTKKATNEPVEADGKIGEAQSFDGANDYIKISHHSSLNPGGDEITIEAWIKAPTDSWDTSLYTVVSKGDWGTYHLFGYEKKLSWHIYTDAYKNIAGSTIIPNNVWTHIAAVYDGEYIRVYFNGESDATPVACTGDITIDINKDLHISKLLYGDIFYGVIDEVRIYNRALTPAEIKAGYETGRDDLLDFGIEETVSIAGIHGPPIPKPTFPIHLITLIRDYLSSEIQ